MEVTGDRSGSRPDASELREPKAHASKRASCLGARMVTPLLAAWKEGHLPADILDPWDLVIAVCMLEQFRPPSRAP